MKDIVITVCSSITQKGEPDAGIMEMVTEAKMTFKDSICYLMYDETEISGLDGTKTTLAIAKDSVTLKRYGSNRMELVFERNQRTSSIYHTPYGKFDLVVRTREMDVTLNEEGCGHLRLVYDMLIQGLGESRNVLEVQIPSA